jgi:hypothetical protein
MYMGDERMAEKTCAPADDAKPSVRERARRLRHAGLSVSEIARLLKLSAALASHWSHGGQLSRAAFQRHRRMHPAARAPKGARAFSDCT